MNVPVQPMQPTQAPTAPAPTPPNAYDQSSGLLGNAASQLGNIAEGGILQNINSYLNPYYDQVISNTLDRMEIDRDRSLGLLGDQAIASGAFGGSRQGVAEGQLLGDYNRNVGDITSQLQMQNFNQASGAARQDMFNAISGMTGLGNQYYQIGNDITDRQYGYGQQQQDLMNQILQGGYGQFQNMMQSPYQIMDLFNSVLSGSPLNNAGTRTQSSTPGLFDYLALAAGIGKAAVGGA